MVNDSISDTITRIRNGYMTHKKVVLVPYTRFNEELITLLVREGYVASCSVDKTKQLNVALRYVDTVPSLTRIQRVSKPGLRVYKNAQTLPYVLNGIGRAVVSTSQGLMTDKEARKKGIGGEIICLVY